MRQAYPYPPLFSERTVAPAARATFTVSSEELLSTRLQLDQIIVPQGFSPNGDGINDTWHISGIDKYSVNKLVVVEQCIYQNKYLKTHLM